ncbi:hypothetical protein OEZ85_014257 [Tetradesmus obliquus]|uniref:Uncharacterized protein n=1 Tax=Tetradesmus obliquus TaxID=3088 RepID=A0ABY8UBE0_TETOB|nr:hypothetical protein OEZ85_014257 [Tetradesmus obliquus]
MAQLLSAFKGDDDGDDDADMEMLQAVLMRAFKSKQAKQKQRQAALVKEVHEAVAARLVALEEAMNSELSELAAAGQAQLAALSRVLGDKMGAMAELKAAFEGQLNAAWQDYGEAYGQLAAVQQEVRSQAERKRSSFKRKLAALQQEAGQLLASTEAKVARMKGGGGGMPPAMAAMLQALGA